MNEWQFEAGDAEEMRHLGERLGRAFRAGDLVVLSGPLGAGKTTLTQGIALGMGVEGPVTSPTFVVARVHSSTKMGSDLVHVDAFRLNSLAEVEDLDLEALADERVTVVEWGKGMVEALSAERIEIHIDRDSVPRRVSVESPFRDLCL